MPLPHRQWEPPTQPFLAGWGHDFIVPDFIVRDPDEFPHRANCKELLAPVLVKLVQGDGEGAVQAARRLCQQRQGSLLAQTEYARQLLGIGAVADAEAVLKGALSKNPEHLEASRMFAFVQLQKGELPAALEGFIRSAALYPADSFSQINLQLVRSKLRPGKQAATEVNTSRPAVATSFPPKGVEMSRQAVQSWLDRGFQVLSVNTAQEAELLQPSFPEVEFVINEDTARQETGKDHQYLDALLDALAQAKRPLCGLVNADIIFRGADDAWDQVCAAAGQRFLFGSRINVQEPGAKAGNLLELGFDYFFFPSSFLAQVPRTGFVFGQPAWDLFLPAWARARGLGAAFCYSPVALHVEHPVQWSPTANSRYMTLAMSWLAPALAGLISGDAGCRKLMGRFTTTMASLLNQTAKAAAAPLFCVSESIGMPFAPVDKMYWLRGTDETLVVF